MLRLKRARLVAALALVASVMVAAGCGGGGKKDMNKSPSRGVIGTITAGTLTVGSEIPYPPFEFGRSPHYQGFDIDVVNEVANRLGVKAKFQNAAFATIFRKLAQGKFDAVASAAPITPERQRAVDFSVPYFPADQSLMVKRGSDIKTVADLKGKRVGAQLGTTAADYANRKTDATVRTFQQIDDAFNALEAGQVDAVIHDFPVSKYTERIKKDLVVVQTIPTGEHYGIAFAKGKTKLRDAVDKAIDAMKKDGAYTKIYRKWFRADPPQSILETGGPT